MADKEHRSLAEVISRSYLQWSHRPRRHKCILVTKLTHWALSTQWLLVQYSTVTRFVQRIVANTRHACLLPQLSPGNRATPTFELDLRFSSNYRPAKFHVCTSNTCYTIMLTRICWLSRTNIHTHIHLSRYSQPLLWWSTLQDVSSEPLFGLLIQTDRQTDALKTIPAFTIWS